jgi:serine-type D-Ala-D-Ala carboxypeptidase (penicillin-binding protein 5/6)
MRAGLVALLAVALLAAPARAAAQQDDEPPAISAQSAILVEASTGDILFQRAAEKRRAIASATKLMTALLTMEHAKLGEMVTAADYVALPIESKLSLGAGERLSVADLMRGLMLESANDAAVTLAEHVAGTRAAFVRLMNQRARELKLRDTHFTNPIGLDEPGNYSSARDLAQLALALREHSFVRKVANRTSATLTTGDRERTIRNRNTLLLKDERVNGLKTGHTTMADYVLVGSRKYRRVTLISVVLGTPSIPARDSDTLALLRWGQDRYERINPVTRGVIAGTPEIEFRRGATLTLVTGAGVKRTVPSGAKLTFRDIGVPDVVTGPIRRGQRFGQRVVYADGERIATVPIVSSASVPAADVAQRTKDWFTRPYALILVGALLTGTVLIARRARRGPPRPRTPRQQEAEAA